MRFGIAGTAHWANTVHAPGLRATPGVELVGVWGRDPARTGAMAAAHGVAAFADYDALLDAVDAVSLAVPPAAQPELARRAAARGKHLLLEKPLALDVAAGQSVIDALGASGLAGAPGAPGAPAAEVAAIVFFMRRFVPEIETALAGAVGQPWTRASVRVHSSAMLGASPYAGSVWRQQAHGALWDIAPHVLSILVPALGPVVRVEARMQPGRVVALRTGHVSGAQADITLSLHVSPEQVVRHYAFEGAGRRLDLPEPAIDYPAAYVRAAGELCAMIRGGERRHRCDARFGLEVVRVLAAAEAAMASGRVVEIAANAREAASGRAAASGRVVPSGREVGTAAGAAAQRQA